MEINFYQIDDLLYKSIAPLLVKFLEDKKRALIFSHNSELLKQIDDGLWSFSKTKFVPHGLAAEKAAERQPVLLTNKEENSNHANYLIMLDKVGDDFLEKFDKALYFFNNENLAESKKLWNHYKGKSATLNFYKKENNKWVKV